MDIGLPLDHQNVIGSKKEAARMPRQNILRQRLNDGEPTLSTHIHSVWPAEVEALGHTGIYDYVEFVAEYGPSDLHDLDNLMEHSRKP